MHGQYALQILISNEYARMRRVRLTETAQYETSLQELPPPVRRQEPHERTEVKMKLVFGKQWFRILTEANREYAEAVDVEPVFKHCLLSIEPLIRVERMTAHDKIVCAMLLLPSPKTGNA